MKFRYEYLSLTQVGDVFGVTSHQVGRWLAEIGLRCEAKKGLRPSRQAHDGGYVKDVGTGTGGYMWVWHADKTVKALQETGHRVAIPPWHDLLAECRLNGPFHARPS